MHTNKRREKKILIRRIKRTEETIALSPEVVFTTSASNMAGGTISIRRAFELLQGIPKEQLESSGVSGLFEEVAAINQKLEVMQKGYRSFFGRQERALGDLLPKIVKEYYEMDGYRVEEADEHIDKEFKIDLIAEKNNEIRAIQVKKGTVSSQEIREICEKAPAYFKQKISNQRVKIIEIIAQHFPNDYLQIRDEFMKRQNEVTLNYKDFHQITQRLPKYRYLNVS